VQSGKPVGVFRTHADAPRVLIANSNLVPHWATWEHFNELDRKGLMMYGQMTAGSWIYIGSQGIVQGTYETFVEMGRQHYGGDLKGRWILTAGLGGMGGAQPLAATHGRRLLAQHRMPAEPHRHAPATRYRRRAGRPTSTRRWRASRATPRPARRVSSACSATPPRSCPSWCAAACAGCGHRPDLARTIRSTATCRGLDVESGFERAERDPEAVAKRRQAVDARARRGDARLPAHGRADLRLRQQHPPDGQGRGRRNAFDFPGFVPAYIRPLFCRGVGPFRWVALSGDPEDIYKTDAKVKELIPDDRTCTTGSTWRASASLPGPAGAHLLGRPGRAPPLGLAFNEMVRKGELKAPIVIGRDHLDSGSVASPNRETEAMRTAPTRVRLAAAQRAAQLSPAARPGCRCTTAAASAWASRSTRRGDRLRRHAEAAKRLARVLWNDPGTGVMRHADAGYEIAVLAEYAGKPVGVLVRSADEMAAVLAANPFPAAAPNRVMAIFLDQPAAQNALADVSHRTVEEIVLGRREIYVHYGEGMAGSRLRIPAAKAGTARNMNTVARLAAMAAGVDAG
jgi:urocanate hydratase